MKTLKTMWIQRNKLGSIRVFSNTYLHFYSTQPIEAKKNAPEYWDITCEGKKDFSFFVVEEERGVEHTYYVHVTETVTSVYPLVENTCPDRTMYKELLKLLQNEKYYRNP